MQKFFFLISKLRDGKLFQYRLFIITHETEFLLFMIRFMQNEQIVTTVQEVLANQDFMQHIFQNIYAYDHSIGIAFQGDYNILPALIFPIGVDENGSMYAMVRFDTTRNGIDLAYSGLVALAADNMNFQVLYPGSSNVDFHLFNDVFPAVSGFAGEGAVLADTSIVSEITPSGWSEQWDFLLPEGNKVSKTIDFTSDANGGTLWTMRS